MTETIAAIVIFAVGFLAGNYWAHRKMKGLSDGVTAIKGKLGIS